MKKNLRTLGLFVFAMIFFASTAMAQDDDETIDDAFSGGNKFSNIYVGSYVGFGYSNGWQLDFSPGVGYKIKDWLIAGGGLNYSYASAFDISQRGDKITSTTIGPRIFAKGNVFQQFYAIGEFQYLINKFKYTDAQGNKSDAVNFCEDCAGDPNCLETCYNKSETALYVGAGYASEFGKGMGFYTEFIIDVLYDRLRSLRPSPYTVRIGIFYTF